MTQPPRPQGPNPAELWDQYVRAGMSPDEATAAVQKATGIQPGSAPDAAPEKAGGAGALEYLKGAANAALNGATFGFADEAVGLVSEDAQRAMRENLAEFRHDYPKSAIVADIGGSVAAGGGLLRGGAKVGGAVLARLMPRAAQVAARAGSALTPTAAPGIGNAVKTVGKLAGQGALLGGAAGAGNADGGGVARGAALGATLGGVMGGAAPVAGSVLRGAKNALVPVSQAGARRAAMELVGEAQEAAGAVLLPVDGKPLALMDRLGAAGRKLTRGARTMDWTGKARQTLDDVTDKRVPTAPQRVVDDLQDAFGVSRTNLRDHVDDLNAQLKAINARTFTPENLAKEVSSGKAQAVLLDSPYFREAWEAMREAGKKKVGATPMDDLFAQVEGQWTLTRNPTAADIEMIRKGLRDRVKLNGATAMTAGGDAKYGALEENRNIIDAARALVQKNRALRKNIPWYPKALGELHTVHDAGRAGMAGFKMSRSNATAEEVLNYAKGLQTQGERDALRVGYLDMLARRIQRRDGLDASRRAYGGSGKRGVLDQKRLVGGLARKGKQGELHARMRAEDEIAATERFLSGQSETADKAVEGAGLLRSALAAAKAKGSAAMAVADAIASGNTGKVSQEIARRMSDLDPKRQAAYLKQVARFLQQQRAAQAARRAATTRATASLAGQGVRP